jgi:hypothetical protein
MNTERPEMQDRLERLASAQLRQLPSLRAPAALEARVLAAIALQASPWYARSFRHWPLWARAGFVLLAAAVAYFLSGESVSVFNSAHSELATHGGGAVTEVSSWLNVMRALGRSVVSILQAIPTNWVLLGVAMVFTCYATLVAGGVFAYRTISKV